MASHEDDRGDRTTDEETGEDIGPLSGLQRWRLCIGGHTAGSQLRDARRGARSRIRSDQQACTNDASRATPMFFVGLLLQLHDLSRGPAPLHQPSRTCSAMSRTWTRRLCHLVKPEQWLLMYPRTTAVGRGVRDDSAARLRWAGGHLPTVRRRRACGSGVGWGQAIPRRSLPPRSVNRDPD